ncbi:DUF3558 domain-containing protein [Nocardia sp. CA2R105]|uniref:DUF3558 domain-containing protein n=1 Tax=Nocardia coffeae TaxID=2873381 RepID=UPI001CA69ED1|nr:DUF3558 domain-containing protein [Nocardia coffeae]MBY8860816.1 DUF3558 domain-containing protein [Nocardia coffeae]
MIRRGAISNVLAVGAAVLILPGCSSSGGSTSDSSTATTTSVQVPTGFDPCNAIPQSILDSENLQGKQPDDFQADAGKILWRGCVWADPDGYAVSIRTTNITVDLTRQKHFPGTREFSINGRRAISSQQQEYHTSEDCTVNVEMKGGTLEFDLTNPASAPKTGKTDTCQLARRLAEKVVPSMPTSA